MEEKEPVPKNPGQSQPENAVPQQPQNPQQPPQQPPYQGQPYAGQPYGQSPYQGQPYPQQQPYQGQPYGGQPYGQPPYQGQPYQQPYQPPYQPQYAPQPTIIRQTVIQQPVVQRPVVARATEAEKNASFGAGSSIFMLILSIVATINLITGFVGNIISLDIGGLILSVLDIIIVAGIWVTFVFAKKKKLSSKGISLIRIPYVIQFVFAVIMFVVDLVIWFVTMNILSLVSGILIFIFQCICFGSVNKTLKLARDINQNKSVAGRKAGSFAAIVMIVFAVFDFAGEVISFVTLTAIKEALASTPFAFIGNIIGGGGVVVIVVAAVSLLVSVAGAIVMLKFGNKVKEANAQANS